MYGAFTLSDRTFQIVPIVQTRLLFFHLEPNRPKPPRFEEMEVVALQPPWTNPWVWASPLSLAATYGISSISFPRVTKMFQFTRFHPYDL